MLALTAASLAFLLTSVNAAPTSVHKRDTYLAGAVATYTQTPLASMVGNLVVPDLTALASGSATVQTYVNLFGDVQGDTSLSAGVECSTNAGCAAFYQFLPSIATTTVPNFPIAVEDLLIFEIRQLINGSIEATIDNYSSSQQVEINLPEVPPFPEYTQAGWFVASDELFDFGTVTWTETSAKTPGGAPIVSITPDEATQFYDMDGNANVSTASWGVTVSWTGSSA